jgi:hypothetical protein
MALLVVPIKDGSYHLRFYASDVNILTRPPYISHSVLEPIGDGGAEIKGLTVIVSKEDHKDVITAAKELGFTYVKVTRVKDGKEIIKIY